MTHSGMSVDGQMSHYILNKSNMAPWTMLDAHDVVCLASPAGDLKHCGRAHKQVDRETGTGFSPF